MRDANSRRPPAGWSTTSEWWFCQTTPGRRGLPLSLLTLPAELTCFCL
jgi:hypothetical protein